MAHTLNEGPEVISDIQMRLTYSVERFLLQEADILDGREFAGWLELLTDDVTYEVVVPSTRLTPRGGVTGESAVRLYDDDKMSLALRVRRLGTGAAWADDPPSRTRRLISNVYLLGEQPAGEVLVRSNVLVYRNRLERDRAVIVASRTDRLAPMTDGPHAWQIRARKVLLEDRTMHTKHLTTFL